ncbi:YbaB/EbfC family nucleoid-associated protein [bacterium]|nr:YbaB/EbfC family nucleoid-associated protein [bacterium]
MFQKVDQAKKLLQLGAQGRALKKALAKEEVTVEKGRVKVVVNGIQQIKSIQIDGEEQNFLVKVINEALKKSQKMVAKKAQSLMGELLGG